MKEINKCHIGREGECEYERDIYNSRVGNCNDGMRRYYYNEY